MKDIIPAKKQSPILGLTGMGGGVGSNLGGSLAKKTYIDDVFSNWVYTGNNSARNEPNGIDLADKGGSNCDVLLMSATPIPRTMMMSIYGDMDISKITEKPAFRKKIITFFYRHI